MSAVPKQKLTVAEYLAREKLAPFKSEFFNGETFAMAGASRQHNDIYSNLFGETIQGLKPSRCRAYGPDQRVRVEAAGLFTYPDIAIQCGPPEYSSIDPDSLLNPVVIVEILSESTESYDRSTKFRLYQKIPSLKEYVLVSQTEPVIEQFVLNDEGIWEHYFTEGLETSFTYRAINVTIPMREIYRDVVFLKPPESVT